MKRSQPKRDWSDGRQKVEDEGQCRVCGINRGLQAAHTLGRKHDLPKRPGQKTLWVNPDGIVPLCQICHTAYDHHELDLLPYLTGSEELYAVANAGLEQARIRLAPSDYARNIVAARVEAKEAA